jgi:hypothetical protein
MIPSEYIRLYALYNPEVARHTEYIYARLMIEAEKVSASETRRLKIILSHEEVDGRYTISNNPREIAETLGIEACRNYIVTEIHSMLAANDITVSSRFITMIANFMTNLGILVPITSRGAARQNRGVLADASFEHTTEFIRKAAMAGKWEEIRSTSGCIFLGKRSYVGTGAFRLRIREGFKDSDRTNVAQLSIADFDSEITTGGLISEGDTSFDMDLLPVQTNEGSAPSVLRTEEVRSFDNNPTYPIPVIRVTNICAPEWIAGLIGPLEEGIVQPSMMPIRIPDNPPLDLSLLVVNIPTSISPMDIVIPRHVISYQGIPPPVILTVTNPIKLGL